MAPELTGKYLLYSIIVILLFLPLDYAFAQPAGPMFKVIHLPRKAGYSKEKLNTELASLKDKEAVKKLLRAKNFPAETAIVIQVNRSNNQSGYWTINTSSPTDKEDNRIILQSRDNTATKFFKLSEFKSFFRDTVAIIDTLGIELFIRDEDYPDDQYSLSSTCGKNMQKKKIPLTKGKLIFTNGLITNCKGQLSSIRIYNNSNPDRLLASCKLVFLNPEQQETLLSLAAFTKAEEPGKDVKEIALVLYGYSLNHFGRPHFPQLLNWLEKNNVAVKHGNNH